MVVRVAGGGVWKEFSFGYFLIAEQKLLRTLLLPVLATSSLIEAGERDGYSPLNLILLPVLSIFVRLKIFDV